MEQSLDFVIKTWLSHLPECLLCPPTLSLAGREHRLLIPAAPHTGHGDQRGCGAAAAFGRMGRLVASLLHLRSASRPGGVCGPPSLQRCVLSASWFPLLPLPVLLPGPEASLPAPVSGSTSFPCASSLHDYTVQ